MSSRSQFALLVSGLLSIAAIVVGLDVLVERGGDEDNAIAWVVGVPIVVLGAVLLGAASAGWRRTSKYAQVSCTVWACVLLLAACAIGGAASRVGILLAVIAVAMGSLSVWVTG